jgi:transcriptional regulator with XRE-family HTH domain
LTPLDTERVREWRHRRMLSQQELADRAGTSLFTIQRIERGEGGVRPKTGRAVAEALGVPIEELLPKAPRRSPSEPTLFNGLEEERRTPTAAELNAIRVVEDDCDKLEDLLAQVDLTAEHNEPLSVLLDNHLKVVAATTLPLIEQDALRPLLLPAATRLVELSERIRMAEETRNIVKEIEGFARAS